MKILSIRTDKPDAEIGLYNGSQQLVYETWQAHRQLAETLHSKIHDLLQSKQLKLSDIEGIVVFKGPGSFTGLRIGLSVANALAYGLDISVVSTMDPGWLERGIERLINGDNEHITVPEYGALPHITQQKK